MSSHRQVSYTCPECGHEQEFQMWESVNVQLNPEMKEKILARTFFSQTCDKCSYIANVIYTFLYHDMEARVMIYLVAETDPEKQAEQIESMNQFSVAAGNSPDNDMGGLLSSMADEYTLRVVTDYNQLLEKILILKNGLDDRIVEIYKLYSYAQSSEQLKDKSIDAIYFDESKGDGHKIVMILDNGEVGVLDFSMDFYNAIRTEKSEIIEVQKPKGYVMIDQQWAISLHSKES